MTLPPSNTSATGDADQKPEGSARLVRAESTQPATSNVEYAVKALGDLLNLAFSDALQVDQLARQTVKAFDGIGYESRIELGDRYPALVEALLFLEHQYDRMDSR